MATGLEEWVPSPRERPSAHLRLTPVRGKKAFALHEGPRGTRVVLGEEAKYLVYLQQGRAR